MVKRLPLAASGIENVITAFRPLGVSMDNDEYEDPEAVIAILKGEEDETIQ